MSDDVEKVNRLIRLAADERTNPNEASSAALQACRIIHKKGLTISASGSAPFRPGTSDQFEAFRKMWDETVSRAQARAYGRGPPVDVKSEPVRRKNKCYEFLCPLKATRDENRKFFEVASDLLIPVEAVVLFSTAELVEGTQIYDIRRVTLRYAESSGLVNLAGRELDL